MIKLWLSNYRVYIVAEDEESVIPVLEQVINNQPATNTRRWAVQIEEKEPEPPKQRKFVKLWERVKSKKFNKLDEDKEK